MDTHEAEDAELASIGDARTKARRAREAFDRFVGATQDEADALVETMARAAADASAELARLAVDETGPTRPPREGSAEEPASGVHDGPAAGPDEPPQRAR